jgi:hypothetical protein
MQVHLLEQKSCTYELIMIADNLTWYHEGCQPDQNHLVQMVQKSRFVCNCSITEMKINLLHMMKVVSNM